MLQKKKHLPITSVEINSNKRTVLSGIATVFPTIEDYIKKDSIYKVRNSKNIWIQLMQGTNSNY
jgi:tRNA-binding EMAP/Myf-like protein